MAQSQIQVQSQEQSLKQTQNLSQQQLLLSQLVELPVTQLLERINAEMDDNPALEVVSGDEVADWKEEAEADDNLPIEEDYAQQNEREERQSALDDALAGI